MKVFRLLKNRFKILIDLNFRRTVRVQHEFVVGSKFIYLDMYTDSPLRGEALIEYYQNTINEQNIKWKLEDTYLRIIEAPKKNSDLKVIRDFVEVVVLTTINTKRSVFTYLNDVKVYTKQHKRNSKLEDILE